MSLTYHIEPGGVLKGRIRVPGDKSISHRSIMLASIAEGVTRISGFLEGEDAIATMNAFRALGVRLDGPERGNVAVHGVGLQGLRQPASTLDCGNAGTAMRLLAGLLAGQRFDCALTGDEVGARDVQLVLPETGVCTTSILDERGVACCAPAAELSDPAACCGGADTAAAEAGCCGSSVPQLIQLQAVTKGSCC